MIFSQKIFLLIFYPPRIFVKRFSSGFTIFLKKIAKELKMRSPCLKIRGEPANAGWRFRLTKFIWGPRKSSDFWEKGAMSDNRILQKQNSPERKLRRRQVKLHCFSKIFKKIFEKVKFRSFQNWWGYDNVLLYGGL